MVEWLIWVVSFLSLYLGVFWVHIIFQKIAPKPQPKEFPTFSLIVPARNEEQGLAKTIGSITNLNYPNERYEILIVNHGSTDKTEKVAKELIEKYPNNNIKLIFKEHEPNHIKAHAFNEGLKKATGEFIGCVDADTVLIKDCLLRIIQEFDDEKVGAVISTIKVTNPKNFLEKIQHLEYIFSTFIRSLMAKINTLHITPGALSVYRKKMFDKFGPFDENNVTEDLEMAMRLQYHGYKIKIATESVTYTKVPNTIKTHWDQRVRWYRGFLYNNMKYRKMMLNKKYGMMGGFQYPVNFITVFIVIFMFIILGYELLRQAIKIIHSLSYLGIDFFIFTMPSLKEIILDLNITLLFPIAISFLIGLFIYHSAHKSLKEKWRFPLALGAYILVYPILRGMQWFAALFQEIIKTKRKW